MPLQKHRCASRLLPTPTLGMAGALALALLAGCASPPTSPPANTTSPGGAATPSSRAWQGAPSPEVAARLNQEQASDVTLHALSLVGTPYRYGGNTPETGFDCSGLIGYVYRLSAAVLAPRTVASLVDWGQPVDAGALRSGDLVVFTQNGVSSHAGIYVGEGRFVHAPSKGGVVRLDSMGSKYWSRQQVSYRRP
ncbi:hydrolase Nlp/P60 [Rhodoferax lacus]|uniref:Hydrolase Nlp/P60 n=1 Tax=Rhodoferax lacus TaxID=2184758 RepID=A0A3E1RGS5_9BURK|nr:C40 family peptidase [Rhodoferax lacus]RFO98222.1 hydrolase Nlp/P60 [Rhodoferax lacus]